MDGWIHDDETAAGSRSYGSWRMNFTAWIYIRSRLFSDDDGEQVDILQVFNNFDLMLHEHGSKILRVYGFVLPKIFKMQKFQMF